MDTTTNDAECNKERRNAELEFVASAYSPDEAWCCGEDDDDDYDVIVRRLVLPTHENNNNNNNPVHINLHLTLPKDYPTNAALQVDATILDSSSSSSTKGGVPRPSSQLLKSALNSLSNLIQSCRRIAIENVGEESVFLVFNQAEEWIQDDWPEYRGEQEEEDEATKDEMATSNNNNNRILLGRRLIYSHHIISKIKRSDIKSLASEYNLTGYMKVGWPGLIIIEGLEEDCIAFYEEIKPWSWQYLVVRGEQQQQIVAVVVPEQEQQVNNNNTTISSILDSHRKFDKFLEVEDMSLVAQHCRDVGLEALFKTSMKVYDNSEEVLNGDSKEGSSNNQESFSSSSQQFYGAMIHVDHMNNPKGYRKWIRRACQETYCHVLIKQCYYTNQDYYHYSSSVSVSGGGGGGGGDNSPNKKKIIVGIISTSRENVSALLKRWRTSRVDVDSKGKPCYERQMKVVAEGTISSLSSLDWDGLISEDNVTIPEEHLLEILESIGGIEWKEAFLMI